MRKVREMAKRMGIVAPCFLALNENLEAWWWTVAGLAWLVMLAWLGNKGIRK